MAADGSPHGRLLLGLDLGTTGTKAMLLDPSSGAAESRAAPSSLHSQAAGWSEADTALWWDNVCRLVPEVLAGAGARAEEVAAVACSGMVPALVALDAAGRPLRRAILQNDARAVTEIAALAAALAERGFDPLERTGSALTQQSIAPTWMWLSRHEPSVAGATATLAGSYDWLAGALGAVPHVETNWALESGLFELDGSLAADVLDAATLPAALLPPVRRPGERVGEVSASAAAACGLRAGTPILVGGADHVLAACAAGLSTPGDWLVKLGGAGDILVVSDRPALDRRWYLDAHPAPGLWVPNGCMATSGSLLRWLQGLVGSPELSQLDAEAAAASPGEVLCLPYFLGEKSPFHDPDLRGAFVGLHLAHGRGALFRAALEAVAFGFLDHVRAFAGAGVALGTARVSNGGSGSALWKQILADVLQTELFPVVDHGGASLGAALVAGVGCGALSSWDDTTRFARLGEPIVPDPGNAAAYAAAYATFGRLQAALAPISHELATRSRT